MQEPKRVPSFGRALFLVVFNAHAMRKAYDLHLFSREFGLGLVCWAIPSGMILLRLRTLIALPEWLTIFLAVFSVCAGWCWVALPFLIYLARKTDQLLACEITPSKLLKTFTGATLWQQAVQGRLTLQFAAALVLESGFIWVLFPWPLSASWQVLFHAAFILNTVFYLLFPLLLFLGAWVQRGMHKALFHQQGAI